MATAKHLWRPAETLGDELHPGIHIEFFGRLGPEDVLGRLETSTAGLSLDEAATRLARVGLNINVRSDAGSPAAA
jgi:Cation transporter/ATPase, N-terminus